MTTYGPLPDSYIPDASRALTRRLVGAACIDLGLRSDPRLRWVADVTDRAVAPAIRGTRRWTFDEPVNGWASGWESLDSSIYLVWPKADRATLFHELRHVWQRLHGGRAFADDVESREVDATAYARRALGLKPEAPVRSAGPSAATVEAARRRADELIAESRRSDIDRLTRMLTRAVERRAQPASTGECSLPWPDACSLPWS